MGDPNFKRSVVLLVEHNDLGSVGFTLNQGTDQSLSRVLLDYTGPEIAIRQGGPVELNTLHLIHRNSAVLESGEIKPGIFWGGHFGQVLDGLNTGLFNPQDFIFLAGYSGWAPGQLENELKEEAWLVSETQSDWVFAEDYDQQSYWKKHIRHLGGNFTYLADAPENPILN
jgi:putative transcriptional regulator